MLSTRCLKELSKTILHSAFVLGQRFGFDILPRHYYSEIPNIAELRSSDSWRREYSMESVKGSDVDQQLAWVRGLISGELFARLRQGGIHRSASRDNGESGYGLIEADVLHCFISRIRPQRVLQVGCGVSTAVCLRAAVETGYTPQVACVEPYPTSFLCDAANKGAIRLERQQLQDTDPHLAESLHDGDLFFVDSSHVLGPAGEVSRIVLEWLPRLRKGVYIHFHDILFPYDYAPNILQRALFFSHESVLLHAFLALNSDFRILASLSMLHHKRCEQLKHLLPNYIPAEMDQGLIVAPGHFPSAIYLQREAK